MLVLSKKGELKKNLSTFYLVTTAQITLKTSKHTMHFTVMNSLFSNCLSFNFFKKWRF